MSVLALRCARGPVPCCLARHLTPYSHPAATAGLLVHDVNKDEVLLIWRHRFIAGHWGWEIPAGLADEAESPRDAAIRECAEEAGYRAKDPQVIVSMDTSRGISDEDCPAKQTASFPPGVNWSPR